MSLAISKLRNSVSDVSLAATCRDLSIYYSANRSQQQQQLYPSSEAYVIQVLRSLVFTRLRTLLSKLDGYSRHDSELSHHLRTIIVP